MADVFRVQEGTTNGSPIASTSLLTLDADEAAGPSLAQLLQETVREGARRGSRTSSTRSRNGASKIDSHAPLPSLPSLSSPASRAYISSLLSKDLTALLKEPDELSRQSEVLDGDLANLCYKSIGELLGVGECVDSVEDGFDRMQSALDSLLSCTELLSSSCTDFTASIAPIISSRTRLNLVRNNIASIEDILSIPRLVSTCIRSGWWNEAVDLAFRARELEDILKGPSVRKETVRSRRGLLGKVREDVEEELETLRGRIIEGLRGRALKLPSAVRSIALLRRLSTASSQNEVQSIHTKVLTEPELRLTFLASRWDCLRSQLEQLEMSAASAANSEDRLRSIKRWIEVWREVIGETVTIYAEIFLTITTTTMSSPPGASTLPIPVVDKQSSVDVESPYSALALTNPSSPLSMFLAQAQNALKSLLQHQLPHITAASALVSLQTQLSYCAAAFSKFGFDFRHIPNRAIAARLLEITFERFDLAVETFGKDLSRAFTQSGSRGGKPRLVISAMITAESWDSIAALEESELSLANTSKTSHPPAYIALFPPLAKLLNHYAAALNELRLLPITALYPTVLQALRSSLSKSAAYMVQFAQTALESQQAYPDDEEDSQASRSTMIIRKSSIVLSKCILPWITWALDDIVYPDIDKERWRHDESNSEEILSKLSSLLHIEDTQKTQSLSATQDTAPVAIVESVLTPETTPLPATPTRTPPIQQTAVSKDSDGSQPSPDTESSDDPASEQTNNIVMEKDAESTLATVSSEAVKTIDQT